MSDSGNDEDGVIGYQATTVTPANMHPSAAAALPSIRIIAAGLVHRLDPVRIALHQMLLGVRVSRVEGGQVQLHRLQLLAELAAKGVLHLRHVDVQELRQDAVVDHVLDEAAELRVLADLGDDLVEGNRIEDEVGPQLVAA